jgi:hypothetical protein
MLTRTLSLFAASLAAAALVAAPAQSRTEIPTPNVVPGACTDLSLPTSGFTSRAAKQAKRTHVLRGTASDIGCGVDRVDVSVARKVGKRCKYLTSSSRFSSRATSCGRPAAWMTATGATTWSFKLPKKLTRGTYVVRTRATDFAGNVQHLRSRRLGIR